MLEVQTRSEAATMDVRIPCACGKEIVADAAQAGLSVACTCGRTAVVPAWRRRPGSAAGRVRETGGTGLTPVGWAFVAAAAVAAVAVGAAAGETADALGLGGGRPSRSFRVLIVGGALLVLALVAALLRVVFDVRFYRE